ncbi:YqcC family protein [Neptunicella marina]|uniref:YqcC family protein n=2 Tax=Neptunicella marina TaxID=2125989 RepID=A0A8J6IR27_9ALTE|nr:YqcC family protein [Neptunicella marina]
MNDKDIYLITKYLLTELERHLVASHKWQIAPLDIHQLNSTAPFSCDVMPFENWLQFIFIPKMHVLVDAKHPLPSNMQLLPMAEQSWAGESNLQALLSVLEQFDLHYAGDNA